MCLDTKTIRTDKKKAMQVKTVYRIVFVHPITGKMTPAMETSGYTYSPQTWHEQPVSARSRKIHWWNTHKISGNEFHKGLFCSFLNIQDAIKCYRDWGGESSFFQLWEAEAEDIVWFGKQNKDQIDECVLHSRLFHVRRLDPEAWWV